MAKLFEKRKVRHILEMSYQEMIDLMTTLKAILADDNLPELAEIYMHLDPVELGILIESIDSIVQALERHPEEIIDL